MRLAVVTHNVIKGDGQGRANYEIARHALKNGYQVTLIADRVDDDLVAEGAEWIRVQPQTLRKVNLFKVWQFAREADRVLAKLGGQIDIVHGYGYCLDRSHHVNTSQFVHSAWRKSPVHTARQHKNLYGLYQWTYSTLNAVWERRAYQKARVVVAASSTVRNELKDMGVPEDRLRVILNGADLAEFYPGPADRRALGLPEGVPLALFAGDIRTPRKNLDTVLKAFTQVPPGVHLVVVGRTEGSPFPAMAESLGLKDRIHFLGFRKDVPEIMRATDMFVFPSRYEACAVVLMEAVASGLPVITSRTTGGAEVITEECGIQIDDPNNAEALAAAITSLAADPDRRRSMGQAARRVAEGNTWTHVADAYLRLYRECAASKS